MVKQPLHPKIYHITPLQNLPQIIEHGKLWSDAQRIQMNPNWVNIGMLHIKQRRLTEIEVTCHQGTHVGDYVPFYFCPRSIMLYILNQRNHSEIQYREGQKSIVHLQADVQKVCDWLTHEQQKWAFTDRNAGTRVVTFFNNIADLEKLNWTAIEATQWYQSTIKENKQAEFLTHNFFPWILIEQIGVYNQEVADHVHQILACSSHQPKITVEPSWYY